jgi:hypothetical protein
MENKKYEQLIDLIINEQEDKARELFHEIVVEKSREIYESIMDEEMMGEEGDEMVGEVGQLMDEISAEESGVAEAEEEEADFDADISVDDEDGEDLEMDADAEESDDKPETVDDVKDKFEELLADFERILSGDDADEEMMEGDHEEEVMEAVQLQKVSVTHGDNGENTKSPALHEPKIKAEGVKPVKFSGDNETVPTGPKGPSNEYSKKEGTLIGDVGNTPGMKKAPALKAAPKAVTKDGAADKHSPVAKG